MRQSAVSHQQDCSTEAAKLMSARALGGTSVLSDCLD